MENIMLYEDFINNINNIEKYGYDKSTELYLEDKISYEEWSSHLENINEGKINDFIIDKIFPIFNTIKNKMKKIGEKGIKILQKIYSTIKNFSKKNPIIYKFIIILIVLFILSITTVSASTGGGPAENAAGLESIINHALGFLEQIDTGEDMMEVLKAKAYLIDLRDGVIDNPELATEKAKLIADSAINTVKELHKKGELSKSLYDSGEKLIDYSFNMIKNIDGFKENINIIKK